MNIYKPMSNIVWLFFFLTFLATFVFLYVLKKLVFRQSWVKAPKSVSLFVLIELLFGKGDDGNKKWSDAMRLFFFFFSFACFTFMVAYQGSLFSCLAVPIIPATIGNIFKAMIICQDVLMIPLRRYSSRTC